MRRIVFAVLFAVLGMGASAARADDLGQRIAHNVGDLIDQSLGQISLGIINLHLDMVHGKGEVNVGGGDDDKLAMRVDGKVKVEDGVAKVHAHVDLAILGKTVNLDLPELDLSTATVGSQHVVQVSIPVCKFHF